MKCCPLRRASLALLLLSTAVLTAAPKRILYVTHSAGFRHGSIEPSQRVLRGIAARSGLLEVTTTEDVSLLTAENLAAYDALFFFTSGELPISDALKQAILEFVRSGKGFGGAHSATDTFYTWPEYGELIGGIFDGHPWTQEVGINVEDPGNPAMRGLAPSFRILEEIYQHRSFSRDRVRVLMTLDTASVNMRAEGVNRTDEDFALAWCRTYGSGRAFYTALGHFDETWLDPRVQAMLTEALLWLAGETQADATVRPKPPAIVAAAVDRGVAVLYATGLGPVQPAVAAAAPGPVDPLAWTVESPRVFVNGEFVPVVYSGLAPGLIGIYQVNALLPAGLTSGTVYFEIGGKRSNEVRIQ